MPNLAQSMKKNICHSGRSLATCETSSFTLPQPPQPTMTSIWASLPHDLVLNILSRLPLIRLLRFRTVCKAWNRVLPIPSHGSSRSRPGFALLVSSSSSSQCSSQIMYLDLNSPEKWRRMELDFLPRNSGGGGVKFLASSGGLILLGSATTGELWVVNPATRKWEALPEAPGIRGKFYWAFTVSGSTTHYVVVLGESQLRDGARTSIYESRRATWRSVDTSRSESRAGSWRRVPLAICTLWVSGSVPVYRDPAYDTRAGAFYHVTWDPCEMVSEFRVKEGEWRCEKGAAATGGWAGGARGDQGTPWGLMNVGQKVVMVKVVTNSSSNSNSVSSASSSPISSSSSSSRPSPSPSPSSSCVSASPSLISSSVGRDPGSSLSLWELDTTRLRWSMTTLIPPPPHTRFQVDKWWQFAVGEGCICVTFIVPGTAHTSCSQSESQPGMIYDCESSTWLPMPDLPGLPPDAVSSSLFGFSASLYPL